MAATRTYEEARAILSDKEWATFLSGKRWTLKVGNTTYPPGTDFEFISPFGAVKSAVVLNGDNSFDRPTYVESPFTQVVIWYKKGGKTYFGMVEQARPHADLPKAHGENFHGPVVFMHVVMGFDEKAATGKFESKSETAAREAGEETGVRKILSIEADPLGHNPSPSFTSTWGGVVFVEVDPDQISPPDHDPSEPISGVYFIEARELLDMIAEGKSPRGAYTGVSTSLSALMIFFAKYPQHFPR